MYFVFKNKKNNEVRSSDYTIGTLEYFIIQWSTVKMLETKQDRKFTNILINYGESKSIIQREIKYLFTFFEIFKSLE